MEASMTEKDQQPKQATVVQTENDVAAEQQAHSPDDTLEERLDTAPAENDEDITVEAAEETESTEQVDQDRQDEQDTIEDDGPGEDGEEFDEADTEVIVSEAGEDSEPVDEVCEDGQAELDVVDDYSSDKEAEEPDESPPEEDAIEGDTDEQDSLDEETEPGEVDEQSQAEPDAEIEIETTVESVIEAVLFASDEALTGARIANIVETDVKHVRKAIEDLNARYQANNAAFRIEQIAGGYQMFTLSPYNHWLRKLLRVRSDSKLSPAALETLAIVAYKQPVIRADIEAIRGVAAGEVLRSLMYKGLVKIVGRAELLGRPMLYGTTKKFLEVFGLNSIRDLPKVEELKKPEQ